MTQSDDILEKPILDVHLTQDGVIDATIGGSIYNENMGEYLEWGRRLEAFMAEMKEKAPDRVLTIMDVSKLKHFDVDMAQYSQHLMDLNHRYATKTAIYTKDPATRALIESLTALTKRDNFKLFESRGEALQWLNMGE